VHLLIDIGVNRYALQNVYFRFWKFGVLTE